MPAELPHDQPDDVEEVDDPSLPLKITKVYTPTPWEHSSTVHEDEGKYTVRMQLSRRATLFELDAVKSLAPISIYGSVLEISNTTLEEVKESRDAIARAVEGIEREGRRAQEAFDAQQAHVDAERAAELERLRALAEQIVFD
jgi:hypothetical protein